MKKQNFGGLLTALAGAAVLVVGAVGSAAQDAPAASTPSVVAPPAPAPAAPVPLSNGVGEILKLAQAKVSDDTTVAFIGYSGKIYNLSAPEIVYLRQQGVSDRVLTVMLGQRQKIEAAASAAAPAPAVNVASQPSALVANTAQYAPTYTSPQTTYVQPAPASSVYVIPASTPSYVDYGYSYPYYGGYYGYGYPGVSLAFGFGSGWYGGACYGGVYRAGYYGGGGYHGGGYPAGGYRGGGYPAGGSRGGGPPPGGGGRTGGYSGGGARGGGGGGGHR